MIERPVFKFTHGEVEALLRLLGDLKHDEMTVEEKAAEQKLKKIFARQILSYERKMKHAAADNNAGQSDT